MNEPIGEYEQERRGKLLKLRELGVDPFGGAWKTRCRWRRSNRFIPKVWVMTAGRALPRPAGHAQARHGQAQLHHPAR